VSDDDAGPRREEAPLRVLVVASSPVARAGLESVLGADAGLRVVGSAAPGASLAAQVARHRPDVLLVAREPGDAETLDPTEPVESPDPDALPVVLLLDLDADADGVPGLDALRRGARAVLGRGATAAAIAAAVRAAAAGLVLLEHASLAGVLARIPGPTGGSAARGTEGEARPPLTPREVEVLAMLAEGASNKRIAARLAISEHTVKFHLASIYAKLGVSTRTEAVTAGARRGLVML
jgi:DNA-binding NarL/FixJ family response regulator